MQVVYQITQMADGHAVRVGDVVYQSRETAEAIIRATKEMYKYRILTLLVEE